jgi:hypothetical protein
MHDSKRDSFKSRERVKSAARHCLDRRLAPLNAASSLVDAIKGDFDCDRQVSDCRHAKSSSIELLLIQGIDGWPRRGEIDFAAVATLLPRLLDGERAMR